MDSVFSFKPASQSLKTSNATSLKSESASNAGKGKPPPSPITVESDESSYEENESNNLIGTSQERKLLMDDMQKEYEESLIADQKKEADKLKVQQDEDELRRLQEKRQSRVLPVPDIGCTIRVRHPTLGVISRLFKPSSTMQAAYDWVGSLSLKPKFFSLMSSFPVKLIYPDEKIEHYASTVCVTEERDTAVPLSHCETDVSIDNNKGSSSGNILEIYCNPFLLSKLI